MADGTESPTSSGAPRTEKKRRPIYACLPCHKRRVKASTLIAPIRSCSLHEEPQVRSPQAMYTLLSPGNAFAV
ncbi:hypothetical protein P875_00042327 [Aspergillus parasiticus SU-1]|uniref:Uncharacterized protein n=1 Tax=Aspergillus parasiticus (strain ATCC 56775 / NRRL 5862 / SRRC 143 / SU-1) TaxID=1403190 RepID=A0A0F0I156_ASPPU|nr:hypothetical protein P875_00042327 [Aspergillus parasiticus SU-1]